LKEKVLDKRYLERNNNYREMSGISGNEFIEMGGYT
jgi:hypothetical protein